MDGQQADPPEPKTETAPVHPDQQSLFAGNARDMTLPPPAEPSGPTMSEWISRKQYWEKQRRELERVTDKTVWDDECEDLWRNNPEAWFAKYEPRWGNYEDYLLSLNGLLTVVWDDDEIPYA